MKPASSPAIDAPPSSPRSSEFFNVYLAGVGSVGTALLEQIETVSKTAPSLRLIGACTSQRSLWNSSGLDTSNASARMGDANPLDWPRVLQQIEQESPRPLIFVDATGSPEVASFYERLFRKGVHVVTSSKLANTRSLDAFVRLENTAHEHEVGYHYETTVGAGLPVVQTVRNLVETGDRLQAIRGVASGTLTFLFNKLRTDTSFSQAVRSAIEQGYAEPDVRSDLSGKDVARKFLILARTAGYPLSWEDVHVESLVPEDLEDVPLESFLDDLSSMNEYWRERSQAAASDGKKLQYVGQLTKDKGIKIGVQAVSTDTALGRLDGQNNLFEITSDRYNFSPLTIQGPGAGPEVTAAGVLADIRKVTRQNAGQGSDAKNRSLIQTQV